MYSNSTSNMNINTNGNIVRTKIKLTDAKGIHIATFATGNGWSDGKCSEAFLTAVPLKLMANQRRLLESCLHRKQY